MSAHQAVFPIAVMARVLRVSEAGFHAWRQRLPSAHAMADAVLLKRVRTIHASSRETYGAPRVHAELRAGGEKHGRKRIARLMRKAGLVGASRRRSGVTTTRRDRDARPAPDLSIGISPRQRQTSCRLPPSPWCQQPRDFCSCPSS
jgi:putative transposase